MAQPLQSEFSRTTNSCTLRYYNADYLALTTCIGRTAAWLSQNDRKSLDIRGFAKSCLPMLLIPSFLNSHALASLPSFLHVEFERKVKIVNEPQQHQMNNFCWWKAPISLDTVWRPLARWGRSQSDGKVVFGIRSRAFSAKTLRPPRREHCPCTSEIADRSDFLHVARQDCTILRPAMIAYLTILLQEDARFKYYQPVELFSANNGRAYHSVPVGVGDSNSSDEVRAMFRTQDWAVQVETFHYEFIASDTRPDGNNNGFIWGWINKSNLPWTRR
ncbi:hypothetical protein EMPG_11172 [Blastomyces silverae]|uniref:Uncharacterized protein n=1 Tax=Blastomyces silverae TaxID=2060906 RepID=A0A0H1B1R2_9EURO|nr:hypothetical protein EMPG_11172 [Blastomyces silverae]